MSRSLRASANHVFFSTAAVFLIFTLSSYRYVTLTSYSEGWSNHSKIVKDVAKIVTGNSFSINEECKVDRFPTVFHKNFVKEKVKAVSIHVVEPSNAEYDSYIKQKSTFTFANDALRFGWRRGVNGARLWEHGNGSQFSLPQSHIRRERSRCVEFSSRVTQKPENLYDMLKATVRDLPPSFLISFRNGLIFGAGNVMQSCGFYQQLRGCVNGFPKPSTKIHLLLNHSLMREHLRWEDMFADNMSTPLRKFHQRLGLINPFVPDHVPVTPLEKVFVIDTHWDFNYHHMLTESAARLVYYLPMLLHDTRIVLHIRADEQLALRAAKQNSRGGSGNTRKGTGACIRRAVLGLLGLPPERFVTGPVLAKQVLLPPTQGCSDYLQHPLELRKLAALLSSAAGRMTCNQPTPRQPLRSSPIGDTPTVNIRIHNRPCGNNTYTWRCWDEVTVHRLGAAAQMAFPTAQVFHTPREAQEEYLSGMKNDKDQKRRHTRSGQRITSSFEKHLGEGRSCVAELSCDIQLYGSTDILIAHHGAALTNVMFMKAGSLLIEVVGYFDGKMLPVCGIYGPLAAVFGVHHYIYYYDGANGSSIGIDVDELISSVRSYYDALCRKVSQST